MSTDPHFEQAASVDGYLRRAELLAGLGRYDEAAQELGFAVTLAPDHAEARLLLARLHLAGGRPAEALAAADAAVTAATGTVPAGLLPALVARGMALTGLGRYAEAARCADELLRLGPADGYAQRSAAALLAEARNGQPALNAAWRAVQLTPRETEAHLVLSLVAARLGLFDLAERAYREALELDPELDRAARDVGVVRLERQRYAASLEEALELLAPDAAPRTSAPAVNRRLWQFLLWGGAYTFAAVFVIAVLVPGGPAFSRLMAVPVGVAGLVVAWRLAARVSSPATGLLTQLGQRDTALALAGYAVFAGPALILVYALVGSPWPLVLAALASLMAEVVAVRRSWG